jgi:hypothetical protein
VKASNDKSTNADRHGNEREAKTGRFRARGAHGPFIVFFF